MHLVSLLNQVNQVKIEKLTSFWVDSWSGTIGPQIYLVFGVMFCYFWWRMNTNLLFVMVYTVHCILMHWGYEMQNFVYSFDLFVFGMVHFWDPIFQGPICLEPKGIQISQYVKLESRFRTIKTFVKCRLDCISCIGYSKFVFYMWFQLCQRMSVIFRIFDLWSFRHILPCRYRAGSPHFASGGDCST